MTKVSYRLSNGVTVATYREALESGLRFVTSYEPVPKPPIKLTAKQEAIRIKL